MQYKANGNRCVNPVVPGGEGYFPCRRLRIPPPSLAREGQSRTPIRGPGWEARKNLAAGVEIGLYSPYVLFGHWKESPTAGAGRPFVVRDPRARAAGTEQRGRARSESKRATQKTFADTPRSGGLCWLGRGREKADGWRAPVDFFDPFPAKGVVCPAFARGTRTARPRGSPPGPGPDCPGPELAPDPDPGAAAAPRGSCAPLRQSRSPAPPPQARPDFPPQKPVLRPDSAGPPRLRTGSGRARLQGRRWPGPRSRP